MTLRLVHSTDEQPEPWTGHAPWAVLPSASGEEIFIVDDDADVRHALSAMFAQAGFRARSFIDGNAFLALARNAKPACIILDVYMPGRTGLEILKELAALECRAPIFILSGRGDIPTAIEAIRMGAFDFIEKRWPAEAIVARVSEMLRVFARYREETDIFDEEVFRLGDAELLTRRERDVLKQIMLGASIKEAAAHLRISPRTVEGHRAHIMFKLGARNAADLARIVMRDRGRR